ncbi:zinc finger MYM-type protein 1-like [Arachis ipaensis]|uniref:zinc finger MYM-type protein 1-like n=1 Tax=Arachis ipaensis TaxID=130454 RepID=UPI0007AF8F63|nr:zinc finger MYM-type protein 1-like [Arachis ipaensis]
MAATDVTEPAAAGRDSATAPPSLVLARIFSLGSLNNGDDDAIAAVSSHVASAVSLPLLFSSSSSGGALFLGWEFEEAEEKEKSKTQKESERKRKRKELAELTDYDGGDELRKWKEREDGLVVVVALVRKNENIERERGEGGRRGDDSGSGGEKNMSAFSTFVGTNDSLLYRLYVQTGYISPYMGELGFSNWKKVNNGVNCAFVCHEGSILNSPHNLCVKSCDDLMAQSKHIDKVLDRHSDETIANNHLRLKTSIDAIRWLTFQACAFRGDDESPEFLNRENFIELIKLLASCNQNVNNVVLKNTPENAQYISPGVQKDILHIFARKVRATIREEIGDSKFCIIIDEARDESKREQMYVVLRFVDKHGCVQERYFDLIHEQGYDGPSNMRGEWNGLQALFLKDCPFAYYIHCLAHRLQLTLVSAAKELRVVQANNVANLIADDQLVTGSGLNQIGTLQRVGDTRWESHSNSVRSLLYMFDATCEVLEKSTEEGNFSTRGDGNAAYDAITFFEFVFVLHLMRNILEVSHDLCQALQRKNQDILNALTLVSTTKTLIQRMRESSWEAFIKEVILFCEKHEVEVPDMNALHILLQELNERFNDNMVELLTLSSTLDPRDNYKFSSVNKVCELVERFYPGDFSDQEKFHIRMQAQYYELDVPNHVELTNLCTISELCQGLTKTGKSLTYPLIDRLIRLVLILPVSTATTERSFSAMNIVKNRLRNKMEDEFLTNCLLIYIEKKIAERFDTDFIINEFYDMKNRRVPLR